MDSATDITVHLGQGEQPPVGSSSGSAGLRKLLQLVDGKISNKVKDASTLENSDFPLEPPPESSSHLILSDSGEFDEWLKSTNNFYIKPQANSPPSIKLAGLKSFQNYDVCNDKNGILFTLAKASKGIPVYNQYGAMSITDPINYTLLDHRGHALMNIFSRDHCGLENKVDLVIKGTNRGYMRKFGKTSMSLCNQSDQSLFRFVSTGSVHVIIMGDKNDNESMAIGEICGSPRKVYRMSIETILPVPLKAMLLGACVVLMHEKQRIMFRNNQCIFQKPSILFGLLGVVGVMIIIFLFCIR